MEKESNKLDKRGFEIMEKLSSVSGNMIVSQAVIRDLVATDDNLVKELYWKTYEKYPEIVSVEQVKEMLCMDDEALSTAINMDFIRGHIVNGAYVFPKTNVVALLMQRIDFELEVIGPGGEVHFANLVITAEGDGYEYH